MTTISPAYDELGDAVRQYVALGSGLAINDRGDSAAVIPARDGKPSPTTLYATVLLMVWQELGSPYNQYAPEYDPDDPVRDKTIQSMQGDFSVQWYCKGAYDAATKFKLWAGSPNGVIEAQRRGLIFQGTSHVRNLTAAVSEKFEERAGLDLRLLFDVSVDQDFGQIEHVRIELWHDDRAGAETIDIDTDRPPRGVR